MQFSKKCQTRVPLGTPGPPCHGHVFSCVPSLAITHHLLACESRSLSLFQSWKSLHLFQEASLAEMGWGRQCELFQSSKVKKPSPPWSFRLTGRGSTGKPRRGQVLPLSPIVAAESLNSSLGSPGPFVKYTASRIPSRPAESESSGQWPGTSIFHKYLGYFCFLNTRQVRKTLCQSLGAKHK